jgi:endonuclease III
MPPKALRTRTRPRRARGTASERAAAIFARLAAANPHPKGELAYINPFTLLVAVVLSAQTTDARVNEATRALFRIACCPQKMLELGEARLREGIKSIGLYRNKAKNVIALSKILIAQHGGLVPANREQLEALPGVGRKTANVVLNTAFGEPTVAVDTHVFRVAHRLGLARAATPHGVELQLLKIIPAPYLRDAHHWLILHGRYTCRARKPRCDACVVCDLCTSRDKWFDCGPPHLGATGKVTQ